MAKKYAFDEQKIARYIREGRGKGEGQYYKPWFNISEVPSHGRSSRPHSYKTKREHHFLSDIENGAFFLYHWSDEVIDIREQFPLDRSITIQIANEMGIAHPADPSTGCKIVMTTDLLITTDKNILLARAVKQHGALDNRVIDKLEIERRYWEQKQVDWGIITEKQLPQIVVNNIRWAHEYHQLDGLQVPYFGYWEDRCNQLINQIGKSDGITIRLMLNQLESSNNFAPGDGITAIRHLVSNKRILMDMNQIFDLNADISVLQLTDLKLLEELIHVA